MLGSEGFRYPSWLKVVISLLIIAVRESATASVFLDRHSVGFIVVDIILDIVLVSSYDYDVYVLYSIIFETDSGARV